MATIRIIDLTGPIDVLVKVINSSFATVAEEFNLTRENSPTNPAFITSGSIRDSISKGLILFGLFSKKELIGCIGIEDSKNNNIFYIERLAVIPECRHKKYGSQLLDFAFSEIKNLNGKKAGIAIINENVVLKKWYSDYGFIETGQKKFDHLSFTVCFMHKDII